LSSSASPAAPVRSYEDLKGGQGRAIYYRAKRLRARALLTRIAPSVEVGECAVRVHDLSTTGLSYWVEATDSLPETGVRLPVRLSLGEVKAFSAEGEIVRHQPVGGRTKVALRFLDDHLTTGTLRALHDRVDFERSVAQGLDAYRDVPAAYRAACAEAHLFFEHWRRLLDQREQQLRASEAAGTLALRLAETEASVEEQMRAEWREVHTAANDASEDIIEGDALAASKRYTETLLTPVMHASPFLSRCHLKPRGYPGDYLAMSWMYEGQRRGETIFGRLLDQLGLEERLAATVPVRKRFLVSQIAACAGEAAKRHEGPVRIVSVGAGPAREVVDYLDQTPSTTPMEFILIDQDEQALAFTADALHRSALKHAGRVRILCRHVSFSQLFGLPELLSEVSGADMIYSAGLLDYLRDDVARALLSTCFGLLREGGRLVVGNAAATPGVRWMPEFVLDWTMLYRTESELRALAQDLGGTVELDIDTSKTWHFLVARSQV
jgi:extracellular factor (EF) 3-hydroxypalmitic acid methyl ester biosynthesis protein